MNEAWASQKSFQRKDGGTDGDGRDFRGQARNNDTHASTTDPDAQLYRKSNNAEARLAYLGHLLIDNRHGLIANAMATHADGYAEREAALVLLEEYGRQTQGELQIELKGNLAAKLGAAHNAKRSSRERALWFRNH